jgi:hypothetical protein
MKTLLNPLQKHMNKQSLRYAVSRQMFCPICSNILDAREACEITTTKVEEPITTVVAVRVFCKDCAEHLLASGWELKAKGQGFTLEINRGYRKPARVPSAEEVRAKEERKAARMAKGYEDKFTGNLFA